MISVYLGKPTFPISFALEEVVGRIGDTLKSKHWHKFEMGDVKLVYVPYYIFNCDLFHEQEEDGKISEKHAGKHAISAVTRELNQKVADAFIEHEDKLVNEMQEAYPAVIRKAVLDKKEMEKIAGLRLAAWKETGSKHIIVSGLDMIYFPVWIVYVTVAEGTYKFEISALDGTVMEEDEVPEREKGFLEITGETLEELKEPGAWLRYSKGVLVETGKFVAKKSVWDKIVNELRHNRNAQIGVIAVIAIILILLYL